MKILYTIMEVMRLPSVTCNTRDILNCCIPELPYTAAEVIWAVGNEMAMTVEDVLARRTRALFLDAKAAIEAAPLVADIMMKELGKDEVWKKDQLEQFYKVAEGYLIK
ncbi:MAG: glycerol-3-phosphate dehydrogenase C-terminal domain-containing protein [Chitinophagaceae bacterium]